MILQYLLVDFSFILALHHIPLKRQWFHLAKTQLC